MRTSRLSLWRPLLFLVFARAMKRLLVGLAATFTAIGLAVPATAGVILTNPDLPPQAGTYITLAPISFSGGIDLSDLELGNFLNVTLTTFGADELEEFEATLTLLFDDGSGPQPATLKGPMVWLAYGKAGTKTGMFATEIVSMSLVGDAGGTPIEIRESPSQASLGQTTITDLGGGLFQIDSFFDVSIELSDNGGQFQPELQGAVRFELTPEPTTALLLVTGLLGLAGYRRGRTAGRAI